MSDREHVTSKSGHVGWSVPQPRRAKVPLRRATAQSEGMAHPIVLGVCAGLAAHLGIRVATVRAVVAAASFLLGAGIVFYLALAAIIPIDGADGTTRPVKRLATSLTQVADGSKKKSATLFLFTACVFIVISVLLAALAKNRMIVPQDIPSLLAILIGLPLVWSQASQYREHRSGMSALFIFVGLALFIAGILTLVANHFSGPTVVPAIIICFTLVVGLVFALAPLWFRTAHQLSSTRVQQIRDSERADIAAHLHDSVLQTLTLIRSSSDNPLKVNALALRQERELRSWLYAGHQNASESFAESIREIAQDIESQYGIAIDVVAVGDIHPQEPEIAIAQAVGEAMTNAVRHGKPPVSVYVEIQPKVLEVFIRDNGEGFDPDTISDDRHGVKESIIARVQRAGGRTQIRRRHSSTEIYIRLPIGTPERDGDSVLPTTRISEHNDDVPRNNG